MRVRSDIYASDIGFMPVLPALRSRREGTLKDLGSFVITAIEKISVDDMAAVVKSIALLCQFDC
jgi:hypothetical protein